MPNGLSPDQGITALLDYVLRADIDGVFPWQTVLWVNDVTPSAATVAADLLEATFGGYRRYDLDREMWSPAAVTSGCARSQWGYTPLVWTPYTGPLQTVYGYALIDATTGLLRWIQRFDPADIRPVAVGRALKLLPVITMTSAPCGSG